MFRAASILCALAAVGLAGWALYEWRWPPPGPREPFILSPAEQDLGALPLGEHPVAFSITNPSSQPKRIIGLAEG
jgi:hypothetical protein